MKIAIQKGAKAYREERIISNSMLCLVLVLGLTLSMGGISAYAADDNISTADELVVSRADSLSDFIEEEVAGISEYTKNTQGVGLDQIVAEFLTQYGSEYNTELMSDSSVMATIAVDANNRVVIDGDRIYVQGVDVVTATPDRIASGAIAVSPLSKASGTTAILSYYHAEYGGFGNEIWRIVQEAQFTYTGSSVTVNYADGYYSRGVLSMWQVNDWEDSSQSFVLVSGVWTEKVTSSGNFHWGIEYDGNGLIFQEVYCTIDVRCTVNGAISSYYTLD